MESLASCPPDLDKGGANGARATGMHRLRRSEDEDAETLGVAGEDGDSDSGTLWGRTVVSCSGLEDGVEGEGRWRWEKVRCPALTVGEVASRLRPNRGHVHERR